MISVGNNKAVICKGDFHPAQLYKGDKKIAGYTVESFEGENGVTLENCYNDKLHNAQIFGNSIQDGTPTPENPIEVQSVGELVTEGEYAGKYKIPVTVRGKNLFKYISGGMVNGTIIEQLPNGAIVKGNINPNTTATYAYSRGWFYPGSSSTTATCPFLKIGDIVTISADITLLEIIAEDGHGIGFALAARDKSAGYNLPSTKALNIGETVRLSWTIENTKSDAIYYPVFKLNSNVFKIEDIQIEYGNTATPCEPYIEPQTFNIYLDEPLRKVGDYADCVDFGKSMVVRNVKHKVFNGTEQWEYDASTNKNTLLYQESVTSCVDLSSDRITAMSSRVGSRTWRGVWQNYYKPSGSTALVTGIATVYNMGDGAGGKWLYLKVSPYSTLPTLEEWKAQLAIWYDEGNPFTVWYVISTIEEPIELPELPTFKGTTIIEVESNVTATINGKYKKVEV